MRPTGNGPRGGGTGASYASSAGSASVSSEPTANVMVATPHKNFLHGRGRRADADTIPSGSPYPFTSKSSSGICAKSTYAGQKPATPRGKPITKLNTE